VVDAKFKAGHQIIEELDGKANKFIREELDEV